MPTLHQPSLFDLLILPTLFFFFVLWLFLGRRSRYSNTGYIQVKNSEGQLKFEHRVIAEQVLGRKLYPEEVVHHINGRRDDNRLSNLCVMSDENHTRYHAWYDWIYETYGNYPRLETQLLKLRESFGGIVLQDVVDGNLLVKDDSTYS